MHGYFTCIPLVIREVISPSLPFTHSLFSIQLNLNSIFCFFCTFSHSSLFFLHCFSNVCWALLTFPTIWLDSCYWYYWMKTVVQKLILPEDPYGTESSDDQDRWNDAWNKSQWFRENWCGTEVLYRQHG